MATISVDVLARYAGDAAREVEGVRGLARRRATRIVEREGSVTVALHLALDRDVSIPAVGRAVQEQVRAYLRRMADLDSVDVDVTVDEIG